MKLAAILILTSCCFAQESTINSVAWLGDSNTDPSPAYRWPQPTTFFSMGRIMELLNVAQSGTTTGNPAYPGVATSGQVSRLPLVLASTALYVFLGPSYNDVNAGLSTANTQANLTYMIGQLKAAGKIPILYTMAPATGPSCGGCEPNVNTLNVMTRALAVSQAVPLFDMDHAVSDGTSSENWANVNYNVGDGVHLSPLGGATIGAALASSPAMAVFAHTKLRLVTDNSDSANIAGNGLFQSAPVAGTGVCTGQQLPAGWGTCNQGTQGTPATPTYSFVTDGIIPGSWFRIVLPDATSSGAGVWTIGPAATVTNGHTIQVSFRCRITGLTTRNPQNFVDGEFTSGYTIGIKGNIDGVCQERFTATSTTIRYSIRNNVAGTGSITVDIGQFSVVDLTIAAANYAGAGTWGGAFLFPGPSPQSR